MKWLHNTDNKVSGLPQNNPKVHKDLTCTHQSGYVRSPLLSHQFFSTRSPPWPHIQLLLPSSSLSLSRSYSLSLALTLSLLLLLSHSRSHSHSHSLSFVHLPCRHPTSSCPPPLAHPDYRPTHTLFHSSIIHQYQIPPIPTELCLVPQQPQPLGPLLLLQLMAPPQCVIHPNFDKFLLLPP